MAQMGALPDTPRQSESRAFGWPKKSAEMPVTRRRDKGQKLCRFSSVISQIHNIQTVSDLHVLNAGSITGLLPVKNSCSWLVCVTFPTAGLLRSFYVDRNAEQGCPRFVCVRVYMRESV